MGKKIKKILLKRELKMILKRIKKQAGILIILLVPLITLIIINHLKKKAKKKISNHR